MKKLLLICLVICASCSFAFSQSITPRQKQSVKQQYIAFCAGMNALLPKQVDDITFLDSVNFEDWILKVKYSVILDSEEYSSEELGEMEAAVKEGLKIKAKELFKHGNYGVSRQQFVSLMKATGMRVVFYYYDMNGILFACIPFSYIDY